MKNYSTALRSAISGDTVHGFVHLVDVQFSTGTLRMTDGAFDVVDSGVVYSANALIRQVDSVRQEQQLSAQELTVTFSNVDQTVLATLLNNEQRNRLVIVKRVVLSPESNTTIGALFSCRYRIVSFSVSDDAVTLTLRGAVADFYAVRGIVTTHDSIQRFYPNNTSFINASSVNSKQKWGGQ